MAGEHTTDCKRCMEPLTLRHVCPINLPHGFIYPGGIRAVAQWERHGVSSAIGPFSDRALDYALLVILNYEYELHEIWQAEYDTLAPAIAKEKRRNPRLGDFKKLGIRVFSV